MGRFGVVQATAVTLEELKTKFPQKKSTITEETVEMINSALYDPEFDNKIFLAQLVDYQGCMIDCGASFTEYINAMKFCAHLEGTSNVTEAYIKARMNDAFVQARAALPTDSTGYAELTSAASRYRKTKIVRQILTQSDMPLYLMFQAERYKAVAVLAKEMQTAAYSRDRIAAAKELLNAVKAPESSQIELNIGPNKEARDLQAELNQQLAVLALNQQKLLAAGMDLRDVQRTGIRLNDATDAEVEEE